MKPEVIPVEEFSENDRQDALALLRESFVGVTREVFEADLGDKQLVVLLRNGLGKLRGFSTLAIYLDTDPEGQAVTIACSGDTIVSPEAWGSSALSRTWITAALSWHEAHGRGPLYWLLITSGFRTYRFMPVFFERFFPHYKNPTPDRTVAWMHRLAQDRWGPAYDQASRIVRFDKPQQLRTPLVGVPAAKARDPHIRHYLKLNPGHTDGDELVCLCELGAGNLTRAGRRMVEAGVIRLRHHGTEAMR